MNLKSTLIITMILLSLMAPVSFAEPEESYDVNIDDLEIVFEEETIEIPECTEDCILQFLVDENYLTTFNDTMDNFDIVNDFSPSPLPSDDYLLGPSDDYLLGSSSDDVRITNIMLSVLDALNYINRLMRTTNSGIKLISEYPALPIVVHAQDSRGAWLVFIPGLRLANSAGITSVTMELVSEQYTISSIYRGGWIPRLMNCSSKRFIITLESHLEYVMRFWRRVSRTDMKVLELLVKETRVSTINYEYTLINITPTFINGLSNIKVYLAGQLVTNNLKLNTHYTLNFDQAMQTFPSMRFTLRHVNSLAPSTYAALGIYDPWMFLLDLHVSRIQLSSLNLGSFKYDIYATTLPSDFRGLLRVHPNIYDNFYDAKFYGNIFNSKTGYQIILDYYMQRGDVVSSYPAYPYKSKIVTAAELVKIDGGVVFLNVLRYVFDDPLYYMYQCLHYIESNNLMACRDLYVSKIVSRWDGHGIRVPNQVGYSTLRLALALAIGSRLYAAGLYTNRTTLDQMLNVLLQLQWFGCGHYVVNGQIRTLVKFDHYGGFLVSYGPTASYGYVPFRPSLIDDIFRVTGMNDEYPGPLPTNAEATIIAVNALISYAYYVLGVPLNQLNSI
ncbi:MAG: hypothetical protein QW738_09620 [Nitrososphaeria archaeon]